MHLHITTTRDLDVTEGLLCDTLNQSDNNFTFLLLRFSNRGRVFYLNKQNISLNIYCLEIKTPINEMSKKIIAVLIIITTIIILIHIATF
jgi:hypothetical protein